MPTVIGLAALLLCPAAGAAPPPLSADLDGDGKAEEIRALPGKITAGAAVFECGYDGFTCGVSVVDVHPADKRKELVICGEAPRLDRACDLYTLRGGALVVVKVAGQKDVTELSALKLSAPGNGHLMVESWERLYTRLEKYAVDADLSTMRRIPQPFQRVDRAVACEGQVTLSLEPTGGAAVATTKAGSKLTVLLESEPHRERFLVQSATGLIGWVGIDGLTAACEEVRLTYAAG
jgi:hypothetical protein